LIFLGTRDIFALDITAHKLFEIEAYLRKPRTLKRKHSSGGEMELKRAGATTPGIHTFMRDLRLLFNAARDKLNNEDTGKILIAHSATECQYEGSLLSHYEQVALMEFITNYRSPDVQRKDETLQDEFPENANPPEDLPPNPGSLS
jgi:peptide subunit release factor 1 (eRF1)